MTDPTTPKDPSADEALMHERVFKKKQEEAANDTPAPTSDAAAAFGVAPVQLEHTTSMRHIGDSDLPDFQPDNGPRR